MSSTVAARLSFLDIETLLTFRAKSENPGYGPSLLLNPLCPTRPMKLYRLLSSPPDASRHSLLFSTSFPSLTLSPTLPHHIPYPTLSTAIQASFPPSVLHPKGPRSQSAQITYLSPTTVLPLPCLISSGTFREKPAFSNPKGELLTSQQGVVVEEEEEEEGGAAKGPEASYCSKRRDKRRRSARTGRRAPQVPTRATSWRERV